MFIGRKTELGFLESRYRAQGGQLVVLYGRRRVGKTETLRKFCEGKEHVFYSCTEYTDEQQLGAFSSRMLAKGIPAAKYVKAFSHWEQALASVSELTGSGKKLLIIDEFPYMVKSNPSIPSILQNLWDSRLKNENVMIVLCGSAMSFIEKEILAEKNPLYGRATGILKMTEMDFYEAIEFFPSYSNLDKITAYAVLGGIPHYLKQFDPSQPLDVNIKRSILQRGSILYSEVEFLMRQELRETSVYNTILEAVALGNTKLNDIFQKTQIDKNKLTVYLRNLIDLGIVSREFSVSDGIKEQANVQRGLYQITDNFFRFWYAFVFPNMSELEVGDVEGIYEYAVRPSLEQYISRIYENVCREYLRRLNRLDALPFRFTKIGRWWNKGDELDVMATDRDKNQFVLGECKFRNASFDMSELTATTAKFKPNKTATQVYYYLFSKNGFTADVQKTAKDQSIRLVSVDEMFQE
ncbi:MAG: putative ATPase (AAA+ superfamily) [Bacillota bacterium]|nr:MAG: putative ATPase (AAA+ superfamily) [Bacillota bacterium]MBS3949372.1 ATP-binding protein [Peptococcaceae bacterium]